MNGDGDRRRETRPAIRQGRAPVKSETGLVRVKNKALVKRKQKDIEWDAEGKNLRRVHHGVDRPLLIIIIILVGLGSAMIFSASYPSALAEGKSATYFIVNHAKFVLLGSIFAAICSFVPYTYYRPGAWFLAPLSWFLLVLVLIIGRSDPDKPVQRWIPIGGFTLQPSEIAKISVILLLAWYISKYNKYFDGTKRKNTTLFTIIFPGIIMGIYCGLVLIEKHLSGMIIIVLISLCIIFIAGASVWKMALIYFVPGAIAVGVFLKFNSYALARITTKFDKNADALAERWQTNHGLYAIGNGGLFGTGLGQSNLKHNYVSEAQNDFIFSIWCEELGFIGALILILLFGLLVWRGMLIARRAPDTFSSLVAFGITCQVGIQAALNLLVVTDIMFNTGIPLPFFSYGGSAFVVLMGEMGILLSISRHSYQKKI